MRGATTGSLLVLRVSTRLPPGLLSWPAWEALRAAASVVVRPSAHTQLPALLAAGVDAVAGEGAPRTTGDDVTGGGSGRAVVVAATGDDLALPGPVDELAASSDLPGAALLDLVAVMDRLRSPGGCPWDAEQTHTSLVPYLVEESYETLEAIETGDLDGLREELGDLLLQVVFHARLAQEHPRPWSVDDVADGIVTKLVRRHPHVFARADGEGGDDQVTAQQVEADWQRRKSVEKQRTSALDGVPMGLPALTLADKLMSRAARGGSPVTVAPAADVVEATVRRSGEPPGAGLYGDLLLGLVASARGHGVDAEAALRDAARRYAREVRAREGGADTG